MPYFIPFHRSFGHEPNRRRDKCVPQMLEGRKGKKVIFPEVSTPELLPRSFIRAAETQATVAARFVIDIAV